MSNIGRGYDINKTFIVYGEQASGDTTVISACTGVYTNVLESCSGDTKIFLETSQIRVTGDIIGNTYYGDGSKLSGIISQDPYWSSGSTGLFSIKTINNSGLDAIGDYSFAGGYNTKAIGENSFIFSKNSSVSGKNSVVLGGENISGTSNDTVYVSKLNIKNVSSGTSINNLGVDSNGYVIVGTSEGGIQTIVNSSGINIDNTDNLNPKPWVNDYNLMLNPSGENNINEFSLSGTGNISFNNSVKISSPNNKRSIQVILSGNSKIEASYSITSEYNNLKMVAKGMVLTPKTLVFNVNISNNINTSLVISGSNNWQEFHIPFIGGENLKFSISNTDNIEYFLDMMYIGVDTLVETELIQAIIVGRKTAVVGDVEYNIPINFNGRIIDYSVYAQTPPTGSASIIGLKLNGQTITTTNVSVNSGSHFSSNNPVFSTDIVKPNDILTPTFTSVGSTFGGNKYIITIKILK